MDDANDALWKVAEFCTLEAHLLRAFVEYLNSHSDPLEVKLERLRNWQKEIGVKLANPALMAETLVTLQTARDAPPQISRAMLETVLYAAQSIYLNP